MKKIIATVLAMVMALALCTTAFAAAQTYDVFDKAGNEGAYTVTVTYTKADADAKTIAYYELDDGQGANEYDGDYYVKVTNASDADLVLKYAGKSTIAMYLAEVDAVEYAAKGTAYTNLGTKCGQFSYKDYNTENTANLKSSDKFYTAVNDEDDETYLYVKDTDAGSAWLLVDGQMVQVAVLGGGDTLEDLLVAHTWVLDQEKMTAKCSTCGATAKVYENYTEVPSGADAEQVAGMWVVADATTSTDTKTDSTTSPKTFDAGIAMYVGMALTSVAGSAVVIGKKKEF